MYHPRPIDTSKVKLSKELLKLTELLAENIHEIWASQRIKEGWVYGKMRDDSQKTHPGLVQYKELEDSEKQYDRNTSLETLKTIIALGYKILDPERQVLEPVHHDDRELDSILEQLRQPPPIKLATLVRLWEGRSSELWSSTPEVYRLLGEHILRVGEPLRAYDVLTEGLDFWPRDVSLRQLHALALTRSGSTQRANLILRQLYYEGHTDEETLGKLARTYKDLWEQATRDEEKNDHLNSAFHFYKLSYQLNGGYYTGINAATMALLSDQKEVAHKLAQEVNQICLRELENLKEKGGDLYWIKATLGEVALIQENYKEAEDWYHQAADQHGAGRYSDLSSTRRQARLLLAHLVNDPHRFDHCFRIPPVVVFIGHKIDRPSRALPRFPSQLEPIIKEKIRTVLQKLDSHFGYSSAACGSDILFLETMLELNGEINIILPYDREQFRKDHVDIIEGGNWGERFDTLLEKATKVITVSEQRIEGGSASYVYGNLLLHGLASFGAEKLETQLVPIAVWNELPSLNPTGIANLIEHWKQQNYQIEIINPVRTMMEEAPDLFTASTLDLTEESDEQTSDLPDMATQIKAMLFADTVNFSKLTEEEIPRYINHFMGSVAGLIEKSPYAPIMKNTWGDGLYFVFSDVQSAGLFALDLCDMISATTWADKGLPSTLNLRVALHAGPVYECIDPITGKKTYNGTHVSRAARIEPITPPGQVYASQSFVAMALAIGTRKFVCEYVGQIPLAKGYGVFPMYHVRRSGK